MPEVSESPDPAEASLTLRAVLHSAAVLQRAVPDSVLVGGSAAALYAHHRESLDHVLADLQDRYTEVLEAVEATDGWVTNVRASPPPMTLLGSLGGIEARLRQLRRPGPSRFRTWRWAAVTRCASRPLRKRSGSRLT